MEIYFMNRRAFKSFIDKNKFFKRAINSIDRRVLKVIGKVDEIASKNILLTKSP